MIAHLIESCLHSLSAISYGPQTTEESGELLMSQFSLNLSCHAGVTFEPLQNVDGGRWRGYHGRQDPYSVKIWVVLRFTLSGQLVKGLPLHVQNPELLSNHCMVFYYQI